MAWACFGTMGIKPLPGLPFLTGIMYLLYLDASGSPLQSDATKHYALVGVAVHEGTWNGLQSRLSGLKKRYAFPGEDFELHAMCVKSVIQEQDAIPGFSSLNHQDRRDNVRKLRSERLEKVAKTGNGKKFRWLKTEIRRTDPFVHLTQQERSKLYEESLELIGNHRGLVLFGEAIEKSHPAIKSGSTDPIRQAFEQVITRFDAFLDRRGAYRQLSRTSPGRMSNGLIVMDHDLSTERNIEEQFADYRNAGHPWGHLRHVIDAPFFVSSEKFPGIQIVDLCAYALRRYLDRGAIAGSHEERQFLQISNLFDRASGKLHGLRHYTQGGTCLCVICRERGHAPLYLPPLAKIP